MIGASGARAVWTCEGAGERALADRTALCKALEKMPECPPMWASAKALNAYHDQMRAWILASDQVLHDAFLHEGGNCGCKRRCQSAPARSPTDHCFREDSPTDACSLCGRLAEVHTGCDCESAPAREPLQS